MDGTILQQGKFTSDGTNKTLQIRSDVDFMMVRNYSNVGGATQFAGTEFYWQRGMDANDGLVKFHAAASQVLSESTAAVGVGAGAIGGFTLVDSSSQSTGALTAITSGTNATPPVLLVASTALLRTGDIVRLTNVTGAPNINGIDYSITVVDATHFSLTYMVAPGAAITGGEYRKINFPSLYYPRRRVITAISQAASAVVTTSVAHGYTVGQEVRMHVPSEFGMIEMDNLQGTITAVTAGTFTLNIDSSAFTAFAFAGIADIPFTPAEVVPIGEDTAQALSSAVDILADATINTGYIGIILAGGDASPGGGNGDEMYWVAGKSFSNTVE